MKQKTQAHVFYMKLPSDYSKIDVLPKLRQKDIDEVSNVDVKKEKTYVWLLLLYGIKKLFGYTESDITFTKTENGKWLCDKCYFSLSHRKGYVCVGISSSNIGVDIEKNETTVKNLLSKISTKEESEIYNDQTVIELWSCKESVFKLLNENRFNPKSINTLDFNTRVTKIEDDNIISVATIENVDLIVNKIENYKDVL